MPHPAHVTRRQFAASALSAAGFAMLPSRPTQTRPTGVGLTPYLLFDGTCRAAMEFYRSCVGGDLVMTAVKDSPARTQLAPSQQDLIVHARLRAPGMDLAASDWMARDAAPARGNTMCLYLNGGTRDELRTMFDRLSEGARITDPLRDEFYGTYGALNDRFGVRWMFQSN